MLRPAGSSTGTFAAGVPAPLRGAAVGEAPADEGLRTVHSRQRECDQVGAGAVWLPGRGHSNSGNADVR